MSKYDERDIRARYFSLNLKERLHDLGLNTNINIRHDSNKTKYSIDPESIKLTFKVRNVLVDETIDEVNNWYKNSEYSEYEWDNDVDWVRSEIFEVWMSELRPKLEELEDEELEQDEFIEKRDKLIDRYYEEHDYKSLVNTLSKIDLAKTIINVSAENNNKAFFVGWELQFEHDSEHIENETELADLIGFIYNDKCYIADIEPFSLCGYAIFDLDSITSYCHIDIDEICKAVEQAYETMVPKLGLYDEFFDGVDYEFSELNEFILAQQEDIEWECDLEYLIKIANAKGVLGTSKVNGVEYLREWIESDDQLDDDFLDF